jgi:hypothetical protein
VLLIAAGTLSSLSNASVPLSLEALRPLIGVLDRVLSEGLAVVDEPVHIKAAKNDGLLEEVRKGLFLDRRAASRPGLSPIIPKRLHPLVRRRVAELHKDVPVLIDIETFRSNRSTHDAGHPSSWMDVLESYCPVGTATAYYPRVPMREWWTARPDEVFWLEITDRPDIGQDLKAPQKQDDGSEFWSYSLVTRTHSGDVVFHYDKNRHAIVSLSRIAGPSWQEDIVWAAHGTSARGAGIAPYRRPGWKVGLRHHTLFAMPLHLDVIRAHRIEILAIEDSLRGVFRDPLYLAFSRYAASLRPQQGYLAKLPRKVVQLFPALMAEVRQLKQ